MAWETAWSVSRAFLVKVFRARHRRRNEQGDREYLIATSRAPSTSLTLRSSFPTGWVTSQVPTGRPDLSLGPGTSEATLLGDAGDQLLQGRLKVLFTVEKLDEAPGLALPKPGILLARRRAKTWAVGPRRPRTMGDSRKTQAFASASG